MMATVQTGTPALATANDLPVAGNWWGRSTQRPLETRSWPETLPETSGGSIDVNLTIQFHKKSSSMADRASTADDLMGREVATMFDKDGSGMGECRTRDAGWKPTRCGVSSSRATDCRNPGCRKACQMRLSRHGRKPRPSANSDPVLLLDTGIGACRLRHHAGRRAGTCRRS